MNEEMKDFDLDRAQPSEPLDSGSTSRLKWVWGAAVVVVLLLVAIVVWRRQKGDEIVEPAAAPQAAEEPAPTPTAPAKGLEIGSIPTLGESDAWLRQIVAQISSHPELAEWLITDELIRKIAVVIDNIAEGKTPSKHLKHLRPSDGFQVREEEGRFFVDPASYSRYDSFAAVIESLDTAGTVELYRAIYPLLQEAYVDLGYPGQSIESALRRAVQRFLATPVIDEPIELEAKISGYEFKDPAQQELSAAAKQFLRLGPDNLQRIQAKVRELSRAAELGLGVG